MSVNTFNYCPICGSKLIKKEIGDEGKMAYCDTCNKPIFDMFNVTPIIMVINEFNEVCLLKQNYISKTFLVFISGYLKKYESVEEAIKREVFEETGLTVDKIEYHLSSFHEATQTLRLGFVAYVKKQAFHKSEKEVDEIYWFDLVEAEKYLNPNGFSTQIYLSYRKKTSN
ncbi:NUDIX domain-containing protein [Acholeplasma hippikon]|nr:NUDIX domain-containing protein [Acholeplasma hippikon]